VAERVGELRRECPGSLVDLEVEALGLSGELRRIATESRDFLIVSKHYSYLPPMGAAKSDYARMSDIGRYVKMVFPASDPRDNLLPISLQGALGSGRLISFCSGAAGLLSRVLSAVLGAPLAYVSLPGRPVAEGQLSPRDMASLVEAVASYLGRRGTVI
jgi:3-dehydroquinate dehydratase